MQVLQAEKEAERERDRLALERGRPASCRGDLGFRLQGLRVWVQAAQSPVRSWIGQCKGIRDGMAAFQRFDIRYPRNCIKHATC